MKFRFASSTKIYEMPTTTTTVTQKLFIEMLYSFIFKDKDPTCSFELLNVKDKKILKCDSDIPVVKKGFAKLFQKPEKMKMAEPKPKKQKRRWKSPPPQKRRKRWRSRSPVRTRRR